jgi:hypothetical protein
MIISLQHIPILLFHHIMQQRQKKAPSKVAYVHMNLIPAAADKIENFTMIPY